MKDNCIHIGIDPGKKGAIAFLWRDKYMVSSMPLSGDTQQLDCSLLESAILNSWEMFKRKSNNLSFFCVLEKAQTMPKQGIVSAFNYGMDYGKIKAILHLLKISYQEVSPTVWKKEYSLSKAGKEGAVDVAVKLFPEFVSRTERGRLLDGHAEALLLAEYGRRLWNKI